MFLPAHQQENQKLLQDEARYSVDPAWEAYVMVAVARQSAVHLKAIQQSNPEMRGCLRPPRPAAWLLCCCLIFSKRWSRCACSHCRLQWSKFDCARWRTAPTCSWHRCWPRSVQEAPQGSGLGSLCALHPCTRTFKGYSQERQLRADDGCSAKHAFVALDFRLEGLGSMVCCQSNSAKAPDNAKH